MQHALPLVDFAHMAMAKSKCCPALTRSDFDFDFLTNY